MKKQLTLLVLAAGFASNLQSQTLQENFTAPFNPAAAGWNVQNLSASANPSGGWSQGTGTVFPAFNGGADDYYSANWASSTATVPATISNWLITPSITLVNGAVLEFATRTNTSPAQFPDRLEVYMSTAGNGVNVGSTPTSLGTFSTLLVTVNPNLTSTGYPDVWTVYSVTLSGLPAPTLGRIGFRYHVTNGGPGGANSDYIGLDAVKYYCTGSLNDYTVCANTPVTLNANGAAANSTYTWSTGGQNSSITVNPSSTTAYTLDYTEPLGVCPQRTATVTIGSNLSMDISASSKTVCEGGSATLTAISAATSYSWINGGQTSSVIAITPSASAIYTVVGWTGNFPPSCVGGNTISITVNPVPTVNILPPTSPLCHTGASVSVSYSTSGATNYFWVSGSNIISSSPGLTVNFTAITPTTSGTFSIGLIGVTNGCASTDTHTLVIAPQPTVTITSPASTVCTNGTVNISASGTDSYQWSGASTSTNAAFVYTAPATAGTVALNVVGTNTSGCTHSASRTLTVAVCGTTVGIAEDVFVSTAVFPNPFVNELRISGLDGKVMVFNALGQVMLVKTVNGSEVINTSELAKGTYLVQALNSNGEVVKTVRVVKN